VSRLPMLMQRKLVLHVYCTPVLRLLTISNFQIGGPGIHSSPLWALATPMAPYMTSFSQFLNVGLKVTQ